MKFTGDPDGIEALKRMREERKDYLKYLVTEVRTNFDHTTSFKDKDVSYKIVMDPQTGTLDVQKK